MALVFGMHILEEHRRLQWQHEGEFPMKPNILNHQINLSPCGWLHVVTTLVRHRASAVTAGEDDEIQDPLQHRILLKIIIRASQTEPSQDDL